MQTQQMERLQARLSEMNLSTASSVASLAVSNHDENKPTVSTKSAATTTTITDLPNIQEYIEQKRQMAEYQDGIKNYQRKMEILKLAAKNFNISTL